MPSSPLSPVVLVALVELPRRRRLAAPVLHLAVEPCRSTASVVALGGVVAAPVLRGQHALTQMLTIRNVCKFVWQIGGGKGRRGSKERERKSLREAVVNMGALYIKSTLCKYESSLFEALVHCYHIGKVKQRDGSS
jgi:hypothetical protein